MSKPTAAELVRTYGLKPHPEGGFYKETYRSQGLVKSLPAPFKGDRSYCTAIYYLLVKGSHSSLHRIASDEIWHFHLGDSLSIVQISPDGHCKTIILGANAAAGETLQHVVPAGFWFGAFSNGDFSFVGCTVSPGFDFADFELGKRQELITRFPAHAAVITRLTREA